MSEPWPTSEELNAMRQFLDWGEKAYQRGEQGGYYSGSGWAATQLRNFVARAEQHLRPLPDHLRERIQRWLDLWPVPEASDDLVLTGPEVAELARALGITPSEVVDRG